MSSYLPSLTNGLVLWVGSVFHMLCILDLQTWFIQVFQVTVQAIEVCQSNLPHPPPKPDLVSVLGFVYWFCGTNNCLALATSSNFLLWSFQCSTSTKRMYSRTFNRQKKSCYTSNIIHRSSRQLCHGINYLRMYHIAAMPFQCNHDSWLCLSTFLFWMCYVVDPWDTHVPQFIVAPLYSNMLSHMIGIFAMYCVWRIVSQWCNLTTTTIISPLLKQFSNGGRSKEVLYHWFISQSGEFHIIYKHPVPSVHSCFLLTFAGALVGMAWLLDRCLWFP